MTTLSRLLTGATTEGAAWNLSFVFPLKPIPIV